jgi:hypothetical protein
MKCSYCKNPIQLNSSECEWCGNLNENSYSINNNNNNNSIKNLSELDKEILKHLEKDEINEAIGLKKYSSNLNFSGSLWYVIDLAQNNGVAKTTIERLLEDDLAEFCRSEDKGGWCFVATACYGDYESAEVKVFREFRDSVLMRSHLGRLFVSIYYTVSPPFAKLISRSEYSKKIIRDFILAPILYIIR